MHPQLLVKWLLFLSDFTKFWIFTTVIKKIQRNQISNFVKIRPKVAIKYKLSYNSKIPPFSQLSARISPEIITHSCTHNSGTSPILRQKIPCYPLPNMHFWTIPVLFYSQKNLTWPSLLRSSGQNFEWAPQLLYLHHECRTFCSLWFCTRIIRDRIYYDVFFM